MIYHNRHGRMSKRHALGQGITELAVGAIFMIPLVMFLFDIAVLVLSNQMADTVVKDAARAAANQSTAVLAKQAADEALKLYQQQQNKGWVTSLKVTKVDWNTSDPIGESVAVTIEMKVKLPVPLPGLEPNPTFTAKQKERIVGI